jgi:transcription initiation factor TFIIE subunit alpha
MKLSPKAVESVIRELIGDDAIPLIEILKEQSKVSEFQISTKSKIAVDVIRNQLYRLYNHNLVTFIRKKDKKKGWYIYYWSLNSNRIKYLVTDLKRKKLTNLYERLSREEKTHFFSCKNSCIRVDFEQATNFEYRCPECGELLIQEDNVSKMEDIRKEIKELEKEVKKEAVVPGAQEEVEEQGEIMEFKKVKKRIRR